MATRGALSLGEAHDAAARVTHVDGPLPLEQQVCRGGELSSRTASSSVAIKTGNKCSVLAVQKAMWSVKR